MKHYGNNDFAEQSDRVLGSLYKRAWCKYSMYETNVCKYITEV